MRAERFPDALRGQRRASVGSSAEDGGRGAAVDRGRVRRRRRRVPRPARRSRGAVAARVPQTGERAHGAQGDGGAGRGAAARGAPRRRRAREMGGRARVGISGRADGGRGPLGDGGYRARSGEVSVGEERGQAGLLHRRGDFEDLQLDVQGETQHHRRGGVRVRARASVGIQRGVTRRVREGQAGDRGGYPGFQGAAEAAEQGGRRGCGARGQGGGGGGGGQEGGGQEGGGQGCRGGQEGEGQEGGCQKGEGR